MADTTFSSGTVIASSWLNDVNDAVYTSIPDIVAKAYGDVTFVGTGGDDSVAVQAFVDANKGKTLVIKSATFAGLLLSGSAYNNTKLYVQNHTLATRATSVTNNFGGGWVGIIFQSCDGIVLDYVGNGNRSVQPDEEHIYLVGLAGVSNMQIPRFIGKEVRGDGMYVSQANWTSNSTTTSNLQIGFFGVYNSADDGRNALSLIAYDNVSIGTFHSIKVGGVVNAVRQPGGLDVEPNFTYQTCTGLSIGSAYVRSTGTTCFGIQGKDSGSETYCVTGMTVGSLNSVNTLGASATSGTWALNLFNCNDVSVRGYIGHTLNTQGLSGRVDAVKGLMLDVIVGPCYQGIFFGESSWVRNADVKVIIRSYAGGASGCGVRAVGVSDSTFRGHVSGAGNASSTFAVQIRSNSRTLTQSNVTYSIDTPKDSNNARGYRNETGDTAAFSSCEIKDCRISGYGTWTAGLEGFGVAGIRKRNITGITDVISQPSDGGWTQGDFVNKSNPTKDGNNMTVMGWVRLTTGTANVSGTDWAIANVSHVSPAT